MSSKRTGTFLGIPYDWRRPSAGKIARNLWNPDDPRLFPPRAFGWGYSINFHRLLHPRGVSKP